MEKWLVITKSANFKEIAQKYQIDPVIARILRNREVITDEEINQYLNGGISNLADPHKMKDADLLADILVSKIKDKKIIRIIGDYDIDGVMSTYILRSALETCGACVDIQIPDRMTDGYGLNLHLIEQAAEDGIDTILTCDNGISAILEIAAAKEMGMTVLVTDHHEVPYQMENGQAVYAKSKADAIVNPHRPDCSYPFKLLCGAGVAWKIVCLLFEKMGIPFQETEKYLENVAFATIGDVMELTGENRILVREGLKRLRLSQNVGMKALIAQCNLDIGNINAFHIGFVLGPCVNASGRLDTAKRSLELFCEKEEARANEIAQELVVLNEKRKELTAKAVEAAKELSERKEYANDRVLVLYLENVHESIAGIVAGRLRELYHKPVFILTKGADWVKGSGRSIEEYSMYEEMSKCSDLFLKFGGHPMAAGLSLEYEKVEAFRRRMNELCTLSEEDLDVKVHIDVPMPVDYVTKELILQFSLLEPFGKGNSKPVFADKNLSVVSMWQIGKERKFWKMKLKSEHGTVIEAVYFGDSKKFEEDLNRKFGEGQVKAAIQGKENRILLRIVYYPEINVYMGQEKLVFDIKNYM